jgi:hypothetical protein
VAGTAAAAFASSAGKPSLGATTRLNTRSIAAPGAKKYQSRMPIAWFMRASALGSFGVSARGAP